MLAAQFDPSRKTFDEVYPKLKELREQQPSFHLTDHDVYVYTRYDDILGILNDSEHFTVEGVLETLGEYAPEAKAVLAQGVDWMQVPMPATCDGPNHVRLRSAFQKVLSPRRYKQVEPVVRRIARQLIASFAHDGQCDFVTEFASRFPMLAIFALIGLDPEEEDMDQIRTWTDDMFRMWLAQQMPEEQVASAKSAIALQNHFRKRMAERRQAPRDDLLTELVQKIDAGTADILEDELVIALPISFIGAGYETTAAGITNGVYQLLREPERWQMLLDNRKRIPEIAEECLRFDGPMFCWYRRVAKPVTYGGFDLPAGARILLAYSSANHDEARFADAEQFCPFRSKATPHMTFSLGRHICLGAQLARMEMKIALEEIAATLPNLRLAPDQPIKMAPVYATRVMHHLRLEWDLPPCLPEDERSTAPGEAVTARPPSPTWIER